jgi:hypothetical protein
LLFYLCREIEIESDDETLYQSKRSSQKKRDQHSSLPDLSETLANSNNTYNNSEHSDDIIPSSTTSSVSTTALLSPASPIQSDSKQNSMNKEKMRNKILITFILDTERLQSTSGNHSSPNLTPKSPRKTVRKSSLVCDTYVNKK